MVNDPLDAIASGPTAPDNTVFSDCAGILVKYRISHEIPLSAALEIDGLANTVILIAGTDGTDGNTGSAGAIADGLTINPRQRPAYRPGSAPFRA